MRGPDVAREPVAVRAREAERLAVRREAAHFERSSGQAVEVDGSEDDIAQC